VLHVMCYMLCEKGVEPRELIKLLVLE